MKWWEPIPWLLSFASLYWNWLNANKTTELQRAGKKLDLALDEFKRLRTTIDVALSEMHGEILTLKPLSFDALPLDEWRKQVAERQAKILAAYNKLLNALARADASPYADGKDWCTCIEDHWDSFATDINQAYAAGPAENVCREAPMKACERLQALILAVEKKLNDEIVRIEDNT